MLNWLSDWGRQLTTEGEMILIGSGGLLWHIGQAGLDASLPENSMDVDPITSSEEIAELAYDAIIGSEFEAAHGWHVNLMPEMAMNAFPSGWKERASRSTYGNLTVIVPAVRDLLAPKLVRGEPRDLAQARLMTELGLVHPD